MDEKIKPEKTREYFIDHPEEITFEWLLSQKGFLNNFFVKVRDRELYAQSDDPERRKFAKDIDDSIKYVDFDISLFLDLCHQDDETGIFLTEALRDRNKPGIEEGFRKSKKITEEMDRLLIPLYKRLRELGYEHYPGLV